MPRTILLDVDTGTDDALAILYGVAHPELSIAGISCVAGNAALDQVVINTCKTLDAAGAAEVPVAAGAARPLLGKVLPASHVHGQDGLGGIELPDTTRASSPDGAVAVLRELIMNSADPVTLVGLAPQTNFALLLTQHPEVAERLERIVFMGGSTSVGNATPVAEFNIWHDPEAASIVINSGVPLQMYGLDVFSQVAVADEVAARLEASAHPATRMAGWLLLNRAPDHDTNRNYSALIGDAGALVMLTHPELFTIERLPVQVNLTGIGRGQTIVDRRTVIGQDQDAGLVDPWPMIDVALDVDTEAAAAAFVSTLNSYR